MKSILRNIILILTIVLNSSGLLAMSSQSSESLNLLSIMKSIQEGKIKESNISTLPTELQNPVKFLLQSNNNPAAASLNVLLDESLTKAEKQAALSDFRELGYFNINFFGIYNKINSESKGDINRFFVIVCLQCDCIRHDQFIWTIKTLLDTNKVNVDYHTLYQDTALIKAIQNNNLELVKLLVKYGADVNLFNSHRAISSNPLKLAVIKYIELENQLEWKECLNCIKIIKFLIKNYADLEAKNYFGTALDKARSNYSSEKFKTIKPYLVKLLETAKEKVDNQKKVFSNFVSIMAKNKLNQYNS